MANDIIDINVYETVETVAITVNPNLTTVNINQVTGGGGGGGVTNLSTTQTASNFTINSDTGDDALVPLGNGTLAGATLNDYTTAEKTKLSGIETGAEVNVNADWNAVSGDAQILNKPTIPITIVNTNSLFSTGLGGTGNGATNANNSNFFGPQAGYEATDAENSNFFGQAAGYQATSAGESNFIGIEAGKYATNAYQSSFIGGGAGNNATNANDSIFIGSGAGSSATNANYSNFIGSQTGQYATNAAYSNLFGYHIGSSFTDNNIGSNNVIIGTNISLPDATANAINLGGVLFGTGTHSDISGDPSIIPVSGGRIGIGVVDPTNTLHIYSEADNTSGLRLERLTSASPSSTGKLIGVDSSGNVVTLEGAGDGGSSVNYYLNGGTSQGTFGGTTYYEFSKTAVIGTGADFNISSNGYIASFITDVADPSLLLIPAGNWNLEFFFSSSSAGGSPSFYAELYKYDGTTFTLIASGSAVPEGITNGTAIDAYFTALAVPETVLTVNDRLAIRVYVNASGKTITLHTQNGHLCEVITTFTAGLTALNGLQAQVQNFAVGTTGTDFAINSSGSTHTFNLPDASSTARGVVTTGVQTFAGDKTFTGAISASNLSGTNTGDQNLSGYALLESPTFTGTVVLPSTTSIGTVSSTEIGYLDNVTSSIQTQIDSKVTSPTWEDYSTTSTITGWSAFTTKVIRYIVIGKSVTVNFNLVGTSNANSGTFTVPFNNVSGDRVTIFNLGQNNGQTALMQTSMVNNNNVMSTTVYLSGIQTGSAFTTSGIKVIRGTLTYEIE